jgi:predicted metal-binding protein
MVMMDERGGINTSRRVGPREQENVAIFGALRTIHNDLTSIPAEKIAVREWTRFRCRFGCAAYGTHFCCPPFVPSIAETRAMVAEYRTAVLARFDTATFPPGPDGLPLSRGEVLRTIQQTIADLEKTAFLAGYYRAFGMGGSPCALCSTCVAKEMLDAGTTPTAADAIRCRQKKVMRPSMEGLGIDVFETVRNVGLSIEVLTGRADPPIYFGLVLLE